MAWPAPMSCAAVESLCGVSLPRITGSTDVEELACGVDGLVLIACRAVRYLVLACDQDEPGGVCVDGARHVRGERDGRDELTGCQCAATVVIGEQNRCHSDGFGDRTGHTPVSEAFGGHHEIHRVRVDSVEPFGHHQRRHTEVRQCGPDLAAGTGVACRPGTYGAGHVGCRKRRVDTRREVALLFVEIELHLVCPLGSRGRPSSRSAMMLR
jgi:hypothetical protein